MTTKQEVFDALIGKKIVKIVRVKDIPENQRILPDACSEDVELTLEDGTRISGVIY